MNLFGYYDEISYFLSANEAHLGHGNFWRLKMVIRFELLMSLLFPAIAYILDEWFPLHPVFLLLPVVNVAAMKIWDIIEKKRKLSFPFVRVCALSYFACIFAVVTAIEMMAYSGRDVILFPVMIIAMVIFYIDHYQLIVCYYGLIVALFLALDYKVKIIALFHKDVVLVTAAYAISIFCYFIVLCVQSDTGRGSRELKQKSSIDLLTGVLNKLSFEEAVHDFLEHRDKNTSGTLFIFDFDNFKHVNDNYGHQTGDDVLKFFGLTLKDNFRKRDVVGRIGGDEFMVLMTGEITGEDIGKRCSDILYALRSAKIGEAGGFSASIGVAHDEKGTADFQKLYAVADRALYQAKENGKACYVKYDTENAPNDGKHS